MAKYGLYAFIEKTDLAQGPCPDIMNLRLGGSEVKINLSNVA